MIDGSEKRKLLVEVEFQSSHVIENCNNNVYSVHFLQEMHFNSRN